MVERKLPKLDVASSSLVSRSINNNDLREYCESFFVSEYPGKFNQRLDTRNVSRRTHRGDNLVRIKFKKSNGQFMVTLPRGLARCLRLLTMIVELCPQYVIATETDRIISYTLQYGWIDTHLSIKNKKFVIVSIYMKLYCVR